MPPCNPSRDLPAARFGESHAGRLEPARPVAVGDIALRRSRRSVKPPSLDRQLSAHQANPGELLDWSGPACVRAEEQAAQSMSVLAMSRRRSEEGPAPSSPTTTITPG